MPIERKTMNISDRPVDIDPKASNDTKISIMRDNIATLWSKYQQLMKEKCCVQTTDDLPEGLQNLYYSDEFVEVMIAAGGIMASLIGTALEVEVTNLGAGNYQVGLPDDVTITNNLTMGNDIYTSVDNWHYLDN